MTARASVPGLSKSPVLRRLAGIGACVIAVFAYSSTVASASSSPPAGATTSAAARTASTGTTLPGTKCPVFPADNIWNTKVTALPVDSHSKAWLKMMDAGGTYLHPDYGPGGGKKTPYGIPYVVVSPGQALVAVKFEYASQSDKGPYPFSASTPIEGGQSASGDRHAIMVDPKTCKLYELYDAHPNPDGSWSAASGAVFNLRSNKLRPNGWTSADAAGLPIFAGLIRYDEIQRGYINHAIRFTAPQTQAGFIHPATHFASSSTNPDLPPMGLRLRLKASFDIRPFPRVARIILAAMKTYGLILADNGSPWYFQGATDPRWNDNALDTLKSVPASAFQVVQTGPIRRDG